MLNASPAFSAVLASVATPQKPRDTLWSRLASRGVVQSNSVSQTCDISPGASSADRPKCDTSQVGLASRASLQSHGFSQACDISPVASCNSAARPKRDASLVGLASREELQNHGVPQTFDISPVASSSSITFPTCDTGQVRLASHGLLPISQTCDISASTCSSSTTLTKCATSQVAPNEVSRPLQSPSEVADAHALPSVATSGTGSSCATLAMSDNNRKPISRAGSNDTLVDEDTQDYGVEESVVETPPAANTQESQALLLQDRERLSRRYARYDLSVHSGCRMSCDYYGDLPQSATASELYAELVEALAKIPDDLWRSSSRKNVRPKGEKMSDQITLGLSLGISSRRIPSLTQKTFQLLGLTKLALRYINKLALEQGVTTEERTLVGTSIQLTRNMRSRPHRDVGNQLMSFGTALSDFVGGQLCVEDKEGDAVHELDEPLPRVGKKGFKFRYRAHIVRERLVPFNGKRDIHFTMPFIGDRVALILFSLGSTSYKEAAPLTIQILKEIGFHPPARLACQARTRLSRNLIQLAKRAANGCKVTDQLGRHLPPGRKRYADTTPGSSSTKRRCIEEA